MTLRRIVPSAAALGMAAAAIGLAAATAAGRGRRTDDRLFAWANSSLHRPALDRVFGAVTELGSLWGSAGAAATMALGGRRREAGEALGAAAVTWTLGQALKRAFRRARPYEAGPSRLLIGKPKGASWPSSHPAVLLTFVTVAGRSLGLPVPARAALTGLAAVVAASRVYLGVHYPSDVVGGLLIGRAVADVWRPATLDA